MQKKIFDQFDHVSTTRNLRPRPPPPRAIAPNFDRTEQKVMQGFTVIQEAENDFKDENEDLEDQEDRTLGYQLSEQEKVANKVQMDQIIKEMVVAWSKEKRRLTGTKDLTHSSLIAYAKHYRGLI